MVTVMPVKTDPSYDSNLTDSGKKSLTDRYLQPGENFQDAFARVATAFSDDEDHAQRLYEYMAKTWFMPATPVLANGGTDQGLPISCYLNNVQDEMGDILTKFQETGWLSCRGGGVGTYWGNVREVGAKVGHRACAEGVIPFMQIQNAYTKAMNQGSVRGASSAFYLDVDHPEIEEFIEIRKPTGGDFERKALYSHHGVIVNDGFMRAVEDDSSWDLISRKDGSVVRTVSARSLWIKMLSTRLETGEPYLMFKEAVDAGRPDVYKKLGLEVRQSNLCTEITLATGTDDAGVDRTAVCCLSSLNLEKFDEWRKDDRFIEDVLRFLDNVLQDFIDKASSMPGFERAAYSAERERSVGLGVMGFHGYLMSKMIPFESAVASGQNRVIFSHIQEHCDRANRKLADEKGPCPDAKLAGINKRFSHTTAIAPTASISTICGGATPGIEPSPANLFVHKTDSGSTSIRNKYLQKFIRGLWDSGELKDRLKFEYDKFEQFESDFWKRVAHERGSVQWCDWMMDYERDVFKTAFELDQMWVVEHAAERTPYVEQGQSVNLFFPHDVNKKHLNAVHMAGYKKGLKTLYYCRSTSEVQAKTVGYESAGVAVTDPEECLACQ